MLTVPTYRDSLPVAGK
jgi:Peptidase S24-like